MPGVRTELTLNKEPSLEENDYGCELVAPKCQMELTLPEQMSSGQGVEHSALLEILNRIWGTLYGPQSLSLLLLS